MSVIITDQASTIEFLFSTGERKVLDKDNLNIKEENNVFSKWVYISNSPGFVQTANNDVIKLKYSEVTSPALANNQELIDLILLYKASSGYTMGSVVITDGTRTLTLEPNGSIPVTLQDQHTPTIITHASILEETTTTTSQPAIGDTVVNVTSATGITAGKFLSFFDPASIRFMNAFVISVNVLAVTIDRPFDFSYPIGSYVDVSETNLAVAGTLANPIVAGVRNNAGAVPPPGLELSMDVTRVLFHIIADGTCNLTTFGNLTALTNGLVCRKRDGTVQNIFNVKSNGEMKEIMYDLDIVSISGGQGEDGVFGRLTFAGQNKMGVTIRLEINEDLEFFIQDTLTGLDFVGITVEGSVVEA